MIFKTLHAYKDTPAIVSRDNIIMYKEIYQVTSEFEHLFTEKNLIFHICTNTIGVIVGYVSFIHNEQVVVMLDSAVSREYVGKLLNVYLPEYIYLPEKIYHIYDEYDVVMQMQ